MSMPKTWQTKLASLALAAAVLAAGAPAGAAVAPPPGSVGLRIAPTKYEATLPVGKGKEGTIDVINVSGVTVTVTPTVENARMTGSAGELEFYLGDNPYKLHKFVRLDRRPFTLKPGQGRHVKFRLIFPVGTYPGGYFGAIFFSVTPKNTPKGTSIAQSGRVGTLLEFTLEGEVDQRGRISALATRGGLISDHREALITYQNTGSTTTKPLGVAYQPVGEIVLKDTLGITVRRQKLTGDTVFPGASRELKSRLAKPFWFGRYTAKVSLAPGPGKTAEVQSVSFWVFSPLALGLVIILIALLLSLGTVWRRRRHHGMPTAKETQSASLMSDAAKVPPAPPADDES